tara:strand:- start:205 stop:381 length:177 start_codon:yes stop_codon:yes gene_type:complete
MSFLGTIIESVMRVLVEQFVQVISGPKVTEVKDADTYLESIDSVSNDDLIDRFNGLLD